MRAIRNKHVMVPAEDEVAQEASHLLREWREKLQSFFLVSEWLQGNWSECHYMRKTCVKIGIPLYLLLHIFPLATPLTATPLYHTPLAHTS